MTHLEACTRDAEQLGVSVRGPVAVSVPGVGKIFADLLVEHFGAPKGTLVFTHFRFNLTAIPLLYAMGYAVSSYAVPGEESDAEDFREMLLDWTYCGPEALKPNWA